MTNSKPITNNKEKAKAKKKKDPLKLNLAKLEKLRYEDEVLSGSDLAAYGDALAGAKAALNAIKKTIENAEGIFRAATMRHYCQYYAQTGRAPDMRMFESKLGSFFAVQQNTAKVTSDKAEELKGQGVDLERFKTRNSYTIRMAKASKSATKEIIGSLKGILGEDFQDVVSEYVHVDEEFFENFDDIVKQSLGPGQRLDEKMLEVLRVLSPTIQFREFSTDLKEQAGYDLALEFAHVSAERKKAAKEAARRVKAEAADEKRRRQKA